MLQLTLLRIIFWNTMNSGGASMSVFARSPRFRLILFAVIVSLLPFLTDSRVSAGSEPQDSPTKKEVTVWTITASKVYHCPDSRWYGKVTPGKEVGECQALREGYRPAFGRGCGSECAEKPKADQMQTDKESQKQ
jgi:hypothetical protein